MANHSSALKRMRQSEKSAFINKGRISRIKTFIKKFVSDLESPEANSNFSCIQSEIQKGVAKGVLHKNTANRKISRLHKLLKSVEKK
ncbi:MAG: 30S ribosomal protein S20 [Holosporaceae bacterium]|jgi:small subunit ribosomal protein S20|nr:30S ribosomal protein S20 [Holosporaceae bacterium]